MGRNQVTPSRSIRHILVAIDGSIDTKTTAEEAVRLAKLVGARVTFVSVTHAPPTVLGDPYYQRAVSADLSRARAALSSAVLAAEERDVAFETEIIQGSPADTVLKLARTRAADLIVVGSRGRGAAAGAVLGSVSADIVHGSRVPVLVIHPHRATRENRPKSRLAV